MSNNEGDAMNERQSQLATVLIGVLIVVAGFLIYTVFNNQTALDTPNDLDVNDQATPTETMEPTDTPSETPQGGSRYVVKSGDTLWSIAQQAYNDGYKWQEIADANEIALNDTSLEVGEELTIPALGGPGEEEEEPTPTATPEEPTPTQAEPTATPEEPTPTPTPEQTEDTNDQESADQSTDVQMYTVQHGDTLWSIAE